MQVGDAGARGGQAEEEALGGRLPELRVRPVGRGDLQGDAEEAAQPDVEFVAEQAPPLGKIDAGAVVQALADAKPDAIFNVLFGADLSKFVREGNTRGLFKGREVVSLLTGEPEYLDPLQGRGAERLDRHRLPVVRHPDPRAQGVLPRLPRASTTTTRASARWSATATIKSIAEGIKKAKTTDTEKLVAAFKGLQVDTPFGKITYRAEDHQSTMGAYVGQHQDRRRQGRDGRLRLPRRRQVPAERRRGEEAAGDD